VAARSRARLSDWASHSAASFIAPESRWTRGFTGCLAIVPSSTQAGQHVLEVLHRGCGIKLTPDPPTEHGGRVDEHDLLDLRLGARLQERGAAGDELVPRVEIGCGYLVAHLLVNLLEQGPEEPLLAAKVVIEGALCHAGPAGYLGHAHARVAVAGEQLPGPR